MVVKGSHDPGKCQGKTSSIVGPRGGIYACLRVKTQLYIWIYLIIIYIPMGRKWKETMLEKNPYLLVFQDMSRYCDESRCHIFQILTSLLKFTGWGSFALFLLPRPTSINHPDLSYTISARNACQVHHRRPRHPIQVGRYWHVHTTWKLADQGTL